MRIAHRRIPIRVTSGPLQLRLPTPDCADQLFELAGDPELSRYLQWPAHVTVADSRSYIADVNSLWERRLAYLMTIHEVEGGRLVGSTGVSGLDRPNQRAEVGTWIGIPHQSQGYNRYAKAAIFHFGFEVLALHRLELLVRCDNARSLLATAALPGIRDEGVQRGRIVSDGTPHDARMFALTRDAWNPSAYPSVTFEGALA